MQAVVGVGVAVGGAVTVNEGVAVGVSDCVGVTVGVALGTRQASSAHP